MASLAEITGDGTKRQLSSDMSSSTGVQITNTPNVGKVYDMTNDVDKLVSSAGTFAKTMYAFSDDAMKAVASDHLVQYQLHKADILSNPNLSYEQQQESITNKVLELNNSVKEQLGDDRNRTIYDDTFYNKAKIDYSNTGVELSKLALTRDLGIEKDGFDQLLSIAPETNKNILKDALSNNIKNNKFSVYEVETAIINAKVKNVKDKYLTDRTTLINNDGSINSKNVTNILGDYLTIDQNGKMIPKEGITANEALAVNDLASDISLKEDVYKAKVLKDTWTKNEDIFTKQFVNLTGSSDIKSYSALAGNIIYAMNNNQLDPIKAKTMMTSIEAQVKEIQKGDKPKEISWTKISARIIPKDDDTPAVLKQKLNNLNGVSKEALLKAYPDNADDIENAYYNLDQFKQDVNNDTVPMSSNKYSEMINKSNNKEYENLLKNQLNNKNTTNDQLSKTVDKILETNVESPFIKTLTNTLTNDKFSFKTIAEAKAAIRLGVNSKALSYVADKTVFNETSLLQDLNSILNDKTKNDNDKLAMVNMTKNIHINTAKTLDKGNVSDALKNISEGGDLFTVFNINVDRNKVLPFLSDGLRNRDITADSSPEQIADHIKNNTFSFGTMNQNKLGNGFWESTKKLSKVVTVDMFANNILLPKEIVFYGKKNATAPVTRQVWNQEAITKVFANFLDSKKLSIGDVDVQTVVNPKFGTKNIIIKDSKGKPIEVMTPVKMYKYFNMK